MFGIYRICWFIVKFVDCGRFFFSVYSLSIERMAEPPAPNYIYTVGGVEIDYEQEDQKTVDAGYAATNWNQKCFYRAVSPGQVESPFTTSYFKAIFVGIDQQRYYHQQRDYHPFGTFVPVPANNRIRGRDVNVISMFDQVTSLRLLPNFDVLETIPGAGIDAHFINLYQPWVNGFHTPHHYGLTNIVTLLQDGVPEWGCMCCVFLWFIFSILAYFIL